MIFRTGKTLHALGNVHYSMGEMSISRDYHERALVQYQTTLGHQHYRTGDVSYRVADHFIRLGDPASLEGAE